MSRAGDDTYVDYSLLDDAALGDAVTEKVLGAARFKHRQEPHQWDIDGAAHSPEDFVSWWGAGLVIDKLRAEGGKLELNTDDAECKSTAIAVTEDTYAVAQHSNPIRAILIAALRAREVE